MNCITVFGGTGFLGRRVVHRLCESGAMLRIASRHPGRPARLFVRGAAADHRPRGGIAAGADADALCPLECACGPCRDPAAYRGLEPAGISRTRNFAAIARRGAQGDAQAKHMTKLNRGRGEGGRLSSRGSSKRQLANYDRLRTLSSLLCSYASSGR
jgi:hypothetical protein